jgi:hypothetical protein
MLIIIVRMIRMKCSYSLLFIVSGIITPWAQKVAYLNQKSLSYNELSVHFSQTYFGFSYFPTFLSIMSSSLNCFLYSSNFFFSASSWSLSRSISSLFLSASSCSLFWKPAQQSNGVMENCFGNPLNRGRASRENYGR